MPKQLVVTIKIPIAGNVTGELIIKQFQQKLTGKLPQGSTVDFTIQDVEEF